MRLGLAVLLFAIAVFALEYIMVKHVVAVAVIQFGVFVGVVIFWEEIVAAFKRVFGKKEEG